MPMEDRGARYPLTCGPKTTPTCDSWYAILVLRSRHLPPNLPPVPLRSLQTHAEDLPQVFLLQVVEDSLSIKELVQLSRASRQALHEVLRPRLGGSWRGLGRLELSDKLTPSCSSGIGTGPANSSKVCPSQSKSFSWEYASLDT